MNRKAIRMALVALLMLSAVALSAQNSASQMLNTAYTEVKGTVTTIVNIASLIIGIVGVVSLIVAYSKHTKGDPSSADSLMKVGFGLLIVIVLMQVIRMTLLT